MSSFHKNHGPMISGGCGSTFQLTITNPTGSPPAQTARYHGLACGYPPTSASALAGDYAARVEGPRPVRPHARVGTDLAVPDRDQRVPFRAGGACPAAPALHTASGWLRAAGPVMVTRP